MVKPMANVVTRRFYDHLFALAPSSRGYFPGDLSLQRAKLMATLDYMVQVVDQPETLQATAARLGREHREHGVRDEDYEMTGQALLWALSDTLGAGYTPAVERAWSKLYVLLAETIKAASMRS